MTESVTVEDGLAGASALARVIEALACS